MSVIEESPSIESPKNVTFNEERSRQASASESLSSGRQWRNTFTRRSTIVHATTAESRAYRHAHIFKRPHALHYFNPREGGSAVSTEKRLDRRLTHESGESEGEGEERSTDDPIKQHTRMDLFIDLVWVGIIANLSANYGEKAFESGGLGVGTALAEFVLLFIPIFRVWDYLREFVSNFYKDDIVDRNFVMWILALSVLYGSNAPYALPSPGEESSLKLLIALYLIVRASFLTAYIINGAYLPFIRRQVLFQICATFFTGAIWIAAMFVKFPSKLALLILGNALEHPLAVFMASPASDILITGGWEKSVNIGRYIERHETFFTIILGEGIFRLIEGSPGGMGLNSRTGTVLICLLLYYLIHWIYFNGDQTKRFVHAMRRTWWKPFLWKMYHIIMFGALLTLAASILFLIKHNDVVAVHGNLEIDTTDPESMEAHAVRYAMWSSSVSLAIVLFTMTTIALLNRPLDEQNTLVISSRWIRLAARIPAIVFLICMPLIHGMSGSVWCGVATAVLYFVFLWEWSAGLEKKWSFFEAKDD